MLVLGHRGAAGRPGRPENTLPAVRAAAAAGAAGVEVDVRLTRDGVLVCAHDPDLGRVLGLGSGRGPGVAATAWAALRRVRLPGGAGVPALDSVLDLASRTGLRVVTELKPLPGPDRLATARALAGLLERRRALSPTGDRVTVSSFDPLAVSALAGRGPHRTALLVEEWVPADRAVRRARRLGLDELHLPLATARAGSPVVRRAHEAGLRVVVWTVDDPADLAALALAGADAVISDDPAAALAALGGHRSAEVPARPAGPGVRPGRAALAARS